MQLDHHLFLFLTRITSRSEEMGSSPAGREEPKRSRSLLEERNPTRCAPFSQGFLEFLMLPYLKGKQYRRGLAVRQTGAHTQHTGQCRPKKKRNGYSDVADLIIHRSPPQPNPWRFFLPFQNKRKGPAKKEHLLEFHSCLIMHFAQIKRPHLITARQEIREC